MKAAEIIHSSCKGCHECIDVCPAGAISFPDTFATVDKDRCTGCGSCRIVCRFDAVII